MEASAPVTETPTVREVTAPEDLSTGRADNAPVEKGVEGSQWERFEYLNKAHALIKANVAAELENLTTYKALKAFAGTHKIEIPETTRNPKAIKKLIKEALGA